MTPIEILLILQFLIVYVVDYSGFIEDGLTPLVKRLTNSKVGRVGKPFSCSLCCTLYAGIFYIIIAGLPFFPYIALVALLSILTPVTYALINFIKDLLFKVLEWLYWALGL